VILEIAIAGRLRKIALDLNQTGRSQTEGDPNPAGESFICRMDGESLEGSARLLGPGILSLVVRGRSYRCMLDQGGEEPALYVDGRRYSFCIEDPRSLKKRRARAGGESGPRPIKAPMHGRVVRILAEKGAQVEAHQGVLVIEAMKMQNELKSPKAGRVGELRVAAGDTVNAGEVVAVIE
jgi:acetyl/propionyl-CoA carboxylase alpha subunit